MLQSSSPSALLLISLGLAVDEMSRHGRERWAATLVLAERVRANLDGLDVYGPELTGAAGIAGFDPTKLVVDVHPLHTTGHAAARWLKEHRQINPEFADLRRLVFSLTMGDNDATVDVLIAALAALAADGRGIEGETHLLSLWPATPPEQILTPRQGSTAPSHTVPLTAAAGLVCAEMIVPYPPGVPLIVPGERISAESIDAIHQLVRAGCRIVGIADPSGVGVRCVDDFTGRSKGQ